MKYTVWHAREPKFGMGGHPEFNDENYEKVAEVESENVDDVFRITNHIDSPWPKNPEVRWYKGGGCRSTSVGDVVIDGNGKRYLCEGVGWTEF